MNIIINATQHNASPEQVQAGVIEPTDKATIQKLLTFDVLPHTDTLKDNAMVIAEQMNKQIYAVAQANRNELTKVEQKALELSEIDYNPVLFNSLAKPKVMIGGAPFFMSYLENALKKLNITPVYAFSQRVSVEETQADGSVAKKNVFKHLGFVEV